MPHKSAFNKLKSLILKGGKIFLKILLKLNFRVSFIYAKKKIFLKMAKKFHIENQDFGTFNATQNIAFEFLNHHSSDDLSP